MADHDTKHIIHEYRNDNSAGNKIWYLLTAILLLIVLAVLFVLYGLPYLSNFPGASIPSQIDINIRGSK